MVTFRVDHSKDEFAQGPTHINGIEGFWGLTEVIQHLARERLCTAIPAEVYGFITDQAHRLDAEGCPRLVRHGFLPERG